MIQKGGSSGFLKGTYGLGKPFFSFPFLIETFLFKDKCDFKPQETCRMCEGQPVLAFAD